MFQDLMIHSIISILRGGGKHGAVTYQQIKETDPDMLVFIWDDGKVHYSLCDLPLFKGEKYNDILNSVLEIRIYVAVGSGSLRKVLVEKIKETFKEDSRVKFPSLIHRTAVVCHTVKIGDGCFVGPLALINTCASVGDFCLINSAALVEHDCELGQFVTINPGAILLGSVKIDSFATLGSNATVRENLSIVSNTIIGMNASVVRSPNKFIDGFWGGVPAKPILIKNTTALVKNSAEEIQQIIRWQKPFFLKRLEGYSTISTLTKGYCTNNGHLQAVVSAKLKTICRCNNNILMTSNGTAALYALLTGLNLKHQRTLRWVTQSFTFPSSIQGPLMNSIVCDIDPDLGGPCLQFLEEHLDEFDGIIVTNLFGHQIKIVLYEEWCLAQNKLLVFDNSTTPLGFLSDGRSIHDIGDGSIVSLHETNSIGRGEEGAVMTKRETYQFVERAMNFGFDIPKQVSDPDRPVSDWHMLDIAATSLSDYFDMLVSSDHEQILQKLTLFAIQQLQQRGLELAIPLRLPTILNCLCVRLPTGVKAVSAMIYLNSFGIEAKRYYQPVTIRSEAPESWRLYEETLCLPFHIGLGEKEVRKMVDLFPLK